MQCNVYLYLGKPLPDSYKIDSADIMSVEAMAFIPDLPDDCHLVRLIQTYIPDIPRVYLPANMPGRATEWAQKDSGDQNLSVIPLPFLLQTLRMDAADFPKREMSVALAMVQAFQAAQGPNEYLMVAGYCWEVVSHRA